MSEAKEIASTILSQIGGNRALTMIGGTATYGSQAVRHKDKPFLHIKFKAKAVKSIKQIFVFYDFGTDTYIVEFWKNVSTPKQIMKFHNDPDSAVVKSIEGVYADMLFEIIEDNTGLCLSL